jgi:hypothetical protein
VSVKCSVIGFHYVYGKHTETVVCHSKKYTAIEAFNDMMRSYRAPETEYSDARVLRPSSEKELDEWYSAYGGWKKGVPDGQDN